MWPLDSVPVYVTFAFHREVKVDDQRHLLDVDSTTKQVCRDQHAARPGPEAAQDQFPLFLGQTSVLTKGKKHGTPQYVVHLLHITLTIETSVKD